MVIFRTNLSRFISPLIFPSISIALQLVSLRKKNFFFIHSFFKLSHVTLHCSCLFILRPSILEINIKFAGRMHNWDRSIIRDDYFFNVIFYVLISSCIEKGRIENKKKKYYSSGYTPFNLLEMQQNRNGSVRSVSNAL